MELRFATADDAEEIADIYAPIVRETVISFESEPPSPAEMARRIEEIHRTHPWLVCSENGLVLGYAYAAPHRARAAYRWSTDVSVYVHSDHRQQGIARRLYVRLFQMLRELGYYNAFAGVTLPNEASVGVHESLGFTPVGTYHGVGYKFGSWHDVGWWHLELRAKSDDPPEPIGVRGAFDIANWRIEHKP